MRITEKRKIYRIENPIKERIKVTNTTGITGISWDNRSKKFVCRITVNGKRFLLGYFLTVEGAIERQKQGCL